MRPLYCYALFLADFGEDATAHFFGYRTFEEEVVTHRRLGELADALELAAQGRRIHDRRRISDGDRMLHLVPQRGQLLVLRPTGADANHEIAVAALGCEKRELHRVVLRGDGEPPLKSR